MQYDHRIASDRGSSFLALRSDGSERLVTASPNLDRPVVGDYAAVDENGRITMLAARRGVLARARSDRANVAQVIAVHLDVVFVVTSPGREFSPPRVERYLTAALAGGVQPIVVLNKRDLAPDPAALCRQLARVAGDAPVHDICAASGDGCEALAPYVGSAVTAALVGSSGVGKSTLANWLHGTDRLRTGDTRQSDGRGKHTTTARELIALPGGAWLIDTPGMRGFAPWAGEEALGEAFADIENAAAHCRFRDCAHGGEPGCRVATDIDPARLARWRTLRAELSALDLRDDRAAFAAERKRWKQRSKALRARARYERGDA